MAHTIMMAIIYTGIIIGNGTFAEFTIPLIGTIAHSNALDDMASATVLTYKAGAGIALR